MPPVVASTPPHVLAHKPWRASALAVLACAMSLGCGDSTETTPTASSPTTTRITEERRQTTYPNSASGLSEMFLDMLALAEKKNAGACEDLVSQLILSSPHQWFSARFGTALGARLADEYAGHVARIAQLTSLLLRMAADGMTEVSTERFTEPDDGAAVAYQDLAIRMLRQATELYSVRLTAPGSSAGFHLWSFAYSDGGFRWVGKMTALAKSVPQGEVDPGELRLRDLDSK